MKYGKRPKRAPPAKKPKTASKSNSRAGLRISLKGQRTTLELRAMLHEAVDRLEALGLTHLRNANLYLTPVDAKGNQLTHIGASPIEDIAIERPYRSAAEEHGL